MAKNIILFCDGTNNQIMDRPTNVLRLFTALKNKTGVQVVGYDPGVGTIVPPDIRSPVRRRISLALGLAFGAGLQENLEDGYRFLMQNYEEGDRIFLFGFSRGAYTARGIAGMVNMFGLLHPQQSSLIRYVSRAYTSADFETAEEIREFSRTGLKITFLGLWDTVSAYGFAYDRKTLPFSANNKSVQVVRHAMAIDERRAFFRQNRWRPLEGQDVREVWFTGVHSDVGGGYAVQDSGLALITLQWMVAELKKLDERHGYALVWDEQKLKNAFRQTKDISGQQEQFRGDAGALAHKSLKGLWHVLELLPMNLTIRKFRFKIPFAKRRNLKSIFEKEVEKDRVYESLLHRVGEENCTDDPPNQDKVAEEKVVKELVHESVLRRVRAENSTYDPPNLRKVAYEIEPWNGPAVDPPLIPKGPDYPAGKRIFDIAIALTIILLLLIVILLLAAEIILWASQGQRLQVLALFLLPLGILKVGGALMNRASNLSDYAEIVLHRTKKPFLHLRAGGYGQQNVVAHTKALGDYGIRAYRKMLKLDLAFPVLYGPALGFTLFLAHKLMGFTILWVVLGLLVLWVMVADWIENCTLLSLTANTKTLPAQSLVKLASTATRFKIAGYAICALAPPAAWLLSRIWPYMTNLFNRLESLL